MPFVSVVFKTELDLWEETRERGNERIQAVKKTGELSTYGCGWNVLFALGIVTREQAQQGVDKIVQTHDEHGERAHTGLAIGTAGEPDSIAGIINAKYGSPNLSYDRFRWEEFDMDRARIREAIIARFFPSKTICDGLTEKFMYVLIKYLFDFESGLGHTVLLRFARRPDGGLPVSVLDPQHKTLVNFDKTIDYLLEPTETRVTRYQGIACLGTFTAGGKRKSRLNLKRKSRLNRKLKNLVKRKTRKGGANTLDPEMNPMTKYQEEQYNEMNKELEEHYNEMNKELESRKPTDFIPFLYNPTMKPDNITILI